MLASPIARAAIAVPLLCYAYFLLRYHSYGYAVGGAIILAVYYAAARSGTLLRGPAQAERWGKIVLLAAAVILPGLGLWQYLQADDIGDLDHATYATALWNLAHGHWQYRFQGRHLFGIHSQYTALAWIPVQWAAGGVGLKLGEGLCLLAAVALAYRRYRRTLSAPAWLAAALLLAPCLASQFFFGFHPEFLGAPLLVLALCAYADQRLDRFLICTFLLAFTKETMTLAIAGVLILALWERRSWRWVLWPGLLCCAQMAAYWFLILPRFAPAGNFLAGFLPPAPARIPSLWFRSENAYYALHVFLPFLPLALGYPLRYLALPLPLMAFYAAMPDTLFTVMWPNYAFPLAFLCAAAPILSGRAPGNSAAADASPVREARTESDAASQAPAGSDAAWEARILAACAVTSLLCYPLWREIFSVPAGHWRHARESSRVNAQLPADSSVLASSPCMDRFAARREIAVWGDRSGQGPRPFPIEHYAYVVLDGTYMPYWLVDAEALRGAIRGMSASPAWETLYAQDSLYVFRRKPDGAGVRP